MSVDFPAPVAPTIPTRSPAHLKRDIAQHRLSRVRKRHVVKHDVTVANART
jgi:hypothetical protein